MTSENKHHITYSAEDIQRYCKGRLSPQEMHAMEKAALDDPFLADALEGMGEALRVHDEQLVNAELKNLHQQFGERRKNNRGAAPVRGFQWWHAAAAAIILIVGGYWIFSPGPEFAKTDLAQKTSAPQHEKAAAPALADSMAAQRNIAATDSPAAAPGTTAKDSGEPVSEDEKKAEPGYYKFKTPEAAVNKDTLPLNQVLESKTSGIATDKDVAANDSAKPVYTEVVTIPDDQLAKRNERVLAYDKEVKLQNIVKGVVTDNKNNPLANAFIRLDDKNAYTTDLKGNFNIPVTDTVVQVSVSLPGYNTQNFRLRTSNFDNAGLANQGQNQIRLQPGNTELAEVVVTGYNTRKKELAPKEKGEYYPTALVQNANPTYGWLAFEEYIEKNKRIPADNPNLVGEVVLSFAVNRRGELSEFKIEKSLSPQHDAEARRLVTQGPSWKLVRGRKSRVTVIVRF